jgi:hypothetical protein
MLALLQLQQQRPKVANDARLCFIFVGYGYQAQLTFTMRLLRGCTIHIQIHI